MDIVAALRLQNGEVFVRAPMWEILAAAGEILRTSHLFPAVSLQAKGICIDLNSATKAALDEIIDPILEWKQSAEARFVSTNRSLYRSMLAFDEREIKLIERLAKAESAINGDNRYFNRLGKLARALGPYLHDRKHCSEEPWELSKFCRAFFNLGFDQDFFMPEPFRLESYSVDFEEYVQDVEKHAAKKRETGSMTGLRRAPSSRGRTGLGA